MQIPLTISRLLCSAAENAHLRQQLAAKDEHLAAKDKQIEELTKKLANVKVKASPANPKVAGVYGNKDGTIVRVVYEGTRKKEGDDKSYYIFAPGGSKQYLTFKDQDKWHYEDEEKVLAAVALHEAKMNNLKNASPAKTPME